MKAFVMVVGSITAGCSAGSGAPTAGTPLAASVEAVAPAEFREAAPALERGLFLQDAGGGEAGGADTSQSARIETAGGDGYYQQTSQGYQYYSKGSNGDFQATGWFGEPGNDGAWNMRQGAWDSDQARYDFGNTPTLSMTKNDDVTWSGSWGEMGGEGKAFKAFGGTGTGHEVVYDPYAEQGSQWATRVFQSENKGQYLEFNNWLPQGQSSWTRDGATTPNHDFGDIADLPRAGNAVPNASAFEYFFQNLGERPFWN